MEKEIFLHIGLPKSGSTSIQLSLEKNKDLLHERGFEIFSWGSFIGKVAGSLTYRAICNWGGSYKCRIWETWKYFREPFQHLRIPDLRNIVTENISRTSYPKVIISSEDLCGFMDHPDTTLPDRIVYKLKEVFHDFPKITVILFLRNQADFLTSLYQQIVSAGETVSFDDFFDEFLPLCHWERTVNDVQTCFPGADIVVTTLEHAVKGGGVFKTFCEKIGIKKEEDLEELKGNVRVNPALLPLIKTWGSRLSREELKYLEQNFLKTVSRYEERKAVFFPFTGKHVKEVQKRYHESNRCLFRRLDNGDEPGFEQWAKSYFEPPPGYFHDGENDLESAIDILGRYILSWMEINKKESNKKINEIRNTSFSRGYIRSFIHFSYPADRQVALYGAGSHTGIFLEELKRAGVTPMPVVVTKSPGRSSFEGIKIFDAETFDYGNIEKVIISSRAFEDEIFEELLKRGVPRDKIIRLYGNSRK